jgi:hypothetical protein
MPKRRMVFARISASPWRDTMMAMSVSDCGLIAGTIMNCPCHMAKICGCWEKSLPSVSGGSRTTLLVRMTKRM